MRILALQLKRLGDVVLTTPALERLAAQGEVTLGVMEGAKGLLPAIPSITGAIVYGRERGWSQWQQTIWGKFDRVVDFTGSDRSALVAWLSRAPRRVTFARTKSGWLRRYPFHEFVDSPVRDQHTVEHYAALAGPGATGEELAPRLRVPEDARVKAREVLGEAAPAGYVILHAGTAREEKYWVPERWAELARHLHQQHGLTCVLTGGRDAFEMEHLAALQRAAADVPWRNLAGRVDLLTLAALVAGARLVVSVDTVMVHLAAALQRPQVALFGPTNPFHWRPRHAQAVVFSAAQPEAPLTEFAPRQKGAPMDRLSTGPIIRATDGLLFA